MMRVPLNYQPSTINYPCGCDLTAEWLFAKEVLADGHHSGATPGNRTNF